MEDTNTILVVDDELVGREVLGVMLIDEGYDVAFANNGEEALEKAAELVPDLILLDVMMPGMDGFEVCHRLRVDPVLAEVPVIIVTALDDRNSLLLGIEAGADDFVTKPFDRIVLLTRVKSIIRLNRYRRLLLERSYRWEAEEEIRRRNRELSLLNRVITAAATTLNVRDVLYIACEALAEAFELPQASGLLLDEEQMQFTLVVEYRVPWLHLEQNIIPGQEDQPSNKIPLVGYLSSKDLLSWETPVAIVKGQIGPWMTQVHDLMHEYGLGSLLIVPILIRDQMAGLIELKMVERRRFNDKDLALAQSVATAIGQAMETAWLYQKLQRHVDGLAKTVAERTRELQAERDRTQAILEAVGEAIVVSDVEGTIQYANPAIGLLTGYDSQEILGQNWRLWQTEHQSTEFMIQIQNAINAGQTWRGEVILKRKDGTLYDAALTVAALLDPDEPGQPIGFVSVQQDITPLKEAKRFMNQFVSNVSHELRTSLSTVTLTSGNLDMLYERLSDDERRKMVQDIRKQMRILNNLIGDVLEISRIDSGNISQKQQPVNLAQLVRDEVDKQLPVAQKKSQTLRTSGVEKLTICGSDSQLRQVIRNLLSNAIKYTPDKGHIACEWLALPANESSETAWPGVSSLPDGHWLALRVVDNGIGIDAKDLPHLFDRFYRVESQSNIPGTGLGLSIAQELVELHDGQLAVASTPGEGSIFALYLPLLETD